MPMVADRESEQAESGQGADATGSAPIVDQANSCRLRCIVQRNAKACPTRRLTSANVPCNLNFPSGFFLDTLGSIKSKPQP
jgi:hypothetical protein